MSRDCGDSLQGLPALGLAAKALSLDSAWSTWRCRQVEPALGMSPGFMLIT